ncbi:MAG: hypothetical protein MI861_13145 [Pirellulales bacterium]|nr:hypothetical protein [Pirellulales bacterium]
MEPASSSAANPYQTPAPLEDSGLSAVHSWLPQLGWTAIGLRMVGVAYFIMGTGVVFALLSGFWGGIALITLIGIGTGVALIVYTLGLFFCQTVPVQSGARPWILSSLLLHVLGMLGNLLPAFLTGRLVFGTGLLALIMLLSWLMFVAFLIRLSAAIGRRDLAGRGKKILVLCGVTVSSFFLIVFLDPTLNSFLLTMIRMLLLGLPVLLLGAMFLWVVSIASASQPSAPGLAASRASASEDHSIFLASQSPETPETRVE